jgi:hypothetical protein
VGQFGLDHPHQDATGLVEGSGQLEDSAERGLLLAEFEDADVGAAQVGLKAKRFLRHPGLLAQLTENSSKGNGRLQISLPLLAEVGRKRTIVSSYSYRNASMDAVLSVALTLLPAGIYLVRTPCKVDHAVVLGSFMSVLVGAMLLSALAYIFPQTIRKEAGAALLGIGWLLGCLYAWRLTNKQRASNGDGTTRSAPAMPSDGAHDIPSGYNLAAPVQCTVSCSTCGQKLRVPAGKSLNVICAKCKSRFFVAATGEFVPQKFRIIETVGTGSAASLEKDAPHRKLEPAATLSRCSVCGLEREVSRDAKGFHCTGCKAYNRVEAAERSVDCRFGDLKRATVCAVIGCNEPIPPGRIVCPRHG